MSNKRLQFYHRGTPYEVSLAKKTYGHVTRYGTSEFPLPHASWVILGVSHHHWASRVTTPLREIEKNPKLMEKGLVWDVDHGTVRQWGGAYGGKIPRASIPSIIKAVRKVRR